MFVPVAIYPSSSDPKKKYTVCEVSDGTISCDCMGWTRRSPASGRTCKHTQDYVSYLRPEGDGVSFSALPEPVSEKASAKGGSLADLMAKLERQESRG